MSALHSTDKYGHKYQINFLIDDFDVFSCSPELSFDVEAHGIKVKRSIIGIILVTISKTASSALKTAK